MLASDGLSQVMTVPFTEEPVVVTFTQLTVVLAEDPIRAPSVAVVEF